METGESITLRERYGYKSYEVKIVGVVQYDGGVAAFTDVDKFNKMMDRREDSYNGFFSDEEIKDIDEDFIVSVITKEDIMKMAAQLDHSMGAFMVYFQYLCVLLSAVLIFLITKVIIERNEQSISMVKILGYSNREVASLYLVTTTLVVIVADIVSVFASREIMKGLWKLILARMGGYFPMVITGSGLIRMFLIVFAGYLIVMFVDFRRIRKIPMDQALKDME